MTIHEDTQLEETAFRRLLPSLIQGRSDTPDWPLVLLQFLKMEFNRPRRVWYSGKRVLIDKDDTDHTTAVVPEKAKTRILFKTCREQTAGCLAIGRESFWLLSYEVPSFGGKSNQCADLLGLSVTGGLVVFECKLNNPYAPITSVIEGLDYLSCLTAEPNMSQIQREFQEWHDKPGQIVPQEFIGVSPQPAACHEVSVLASPEYFDRYRHDPSRSRNTQRGSGWTDFAAACEENQEGSPRIRFAQTDFTGTSAAWVTG